MLLAALLFKVKRHSPTLQCLAELCVDHQTVTDFSQVCRKAMSNFVLSCSLQLFLCLLLGGEHDKYVEIDESCFSRSKCNCGRLFATKCLYWCGVGIGGTHLAPVADCSAKTLLAIIKACILPSTTIISEFGGYNICLLNEGLTHHSVDCSIFVAQCSHKYSRGHVESQQHSPQALLRKQSKMVLHQLSLMMFQNEM